MLTTPTTDTHTHSTHTYIIPTLHRPPHSHTNSARATQPSTPPTHTTPTHNTHTYTLPSCHFFTAPAPYPPPHTHTLLYWNIATFVRLKIQVVCTGLLYYSIVACAHLSIGTGHRTLTVAAPLLLTSGPVRYEVVLHKCGTSSVRGGGYRLVTVYLR